MQFTPPKLLTLLAMVLTTLSLITVPQLSQAATKGKAAKEKVILMPMDVSVEDRGLISEMQNAVKEGLSQKYQVYSGAAVLAELKKSADKQNKSTKKNCDETKCLQDVAMAFDNAYVAMVHVKQISGGYTLSISILDVFTNETVLANQLSCRRCDAFQLLDKLKELVGVTASGERQSIKAEAAKGPAMVRIPGKNYELGKYEVTQKEWQAEMGRNPSKFTSCGENCPVEHVSWNDIQEFLQKLNAKTGRQYRLPTESEWEYACYGGNKTEYCGGNKLDSVAWYRKNSNSSTHPVGQKQGNGYGLYDMSGNVWEWMQNWYRSSKGGRVLRGGSWFSGVPVGLRAAYRSSSTPTDRYSSSGFRLARTLP